MPLTVRAVVDLSLLGAAVALLVASLLWRARYGLYLVGLALLGWEVGVLLDRALRPAVRLDLVGLGCGCLAAFTMRRLQVGGPGLGFGCCCAVSRVSPSACSSGSTIPGL